MAKYSYFCKCGWHLRRGDQTRKQYAAEKKNHAEICNELSKELEESKKASANAGTKDKGR